MSFYNDDRICDKDLVELSGYHVYKNPNEQDILTVNNHDFEVMNKTRVNHSGLDAITVERVIDKEKIYSVIFQGTNHEQPQDLLTDAKLLGDRVPQQLQDAKDYFGKMKKKYGKISFVAGNSLGGALANVVALENDDVRSVTLYPAILPGE